MLQPCHRVSSAPQTHVVRRSSNSVWSQLQAIFFAAVVWVTIFLLVSVLTIFIPLCAALCCFQQVLCHQRIPTWFSAAELGIWEHEVLLPKLPSGSTSDTIVVPGAKIHRFLVPGHKVDGPVFLLIHGTFANAFGAWHGALTHLQAHCSELHVLDIPGFGRSQCDFPLPSLAGEKIVEILVESLHQYVLVAEIRKVVVIGSSIGAYIAGNFAETYPEDVESVILSSPAGVLPTLGRQGAYFALLFKLGIPLLIRLGRPGLCIIHTLLDFTRGDKSAYYDFNVRMTPSSINDLPRKFITIGPLSAFWDHPPMLPWLIASKVPVALIHGAVDTIMPTHIGELVSALSHTIPCTLISGAWHVPAFSHPRQFGVAVGKLVQDARRPSEASQLTCQELKQVPWFLWRTPFSLCVAQEMIFELYERLHSLCATSL